MFSHLKKLSLLIILLMVIASGYHYIGKNYPNISLPYKNEIFQLESIVLNNLDQLISSQEDNDKNPLNKLKNLSQKTNISPPETPQNPTKDLKPLLKKLVDQ